MQTPGSVDTRWLTQGMCTNGKTTLSPAARGGQCEQTPVSLSARVAPLKQKTRRYEYLAGEAQPLSTVSHDDMPATVEHEESTSSAQGNQFDSNDIKTPLPVPLHIIESALVQNHVHHRKTKLAKHTWSIRDLSAVNSEHLEGESGWDKAVAIRGRESPAIQAGGSDGKCSPVFV